MSRATSGSALRTRSTDTEKIGSAGHTLCLTHLTPVRVRHAPRVPDSPLPACVPRPRPFPLRSASVPRPRSCRRFTRRWAARGLGYCHENRTFSDGTNPVYGALEEGSKRIVGLKGDPLFSPVEPSGQIYELDEVRLLSPVIPRSKVVGIGNNYSDTPILADERPEPPMFLKANTSVIGPDDPIAIPAWSDDVAFEGELAISSSPGQGCECLGRASGDSRLHGRQRRYRPRRDDGRTLGARQVFRHLLPAGSVDHVDPTLDVTNLAIRSYLNGEKAQDSSTAHMIWNPFELVSYVSHQMTLLPGDVIVTGAPAGCGRVDAGDRVEIEIEGIGSLMNPVVRA